VERPGAGVGQLELVYGRQAGRLDDLETQRANRSGRHDGAAWAVGEANEHLARVRHGEIAKKHIAFDRQTRQRHTHAGTVIEKHVDDADVFGRQRHRECAIAGGSSFRADEIGRIRARGPRIGIWDEAQPRARHRQPMLEHPASCERRRRQLDIDRHAGRGYPRSPCAEFGMRRRNPQRTIRRPLDLKPAVCRCLRGNTKEKRRIVARAHGCRIVRLEEGE
jgi:hypothetical protein